MKDTILLMEQNRNELIATAELLELSGYNVLTAETGMEGLEKAKKFIPNIILCDMFLPGLDGYGVLQALENIPELAGTPFIMAFDNSFDNSEKDIFRRGMNGGADDCLIKPFENDELLRALSRRLNKNRLIKKSPNRQSFFHIPSLLSADEMELFSLSQSKKIKAREYIFVEGDDVYGIYYIKSGKVKTFKTNVWGKDYITNIHIAGNFFGCSIAFEKAHYSETAVTLEDTEVALISIHYFFDVVNTNPRLAIKFLRILSGYLGEAHEQLLHLAYNSVRKRVADALLIIYEKNAGNNMFFTAWREDISGLAGTSPESVSRTLSDLKNEGLIEIYNGKIKITDKKKLQQIKD